MNAVTKPRWTRLKNQIIDNVKHGAPLEDYQLEPDECVTWVDEECEEQQTVSHHFIEAVSCIWVSGNQLPKFDALTRKLLLGTMTADELCEWRDIQRAAMIDYCSRWARGKVTEEMEL